MTITVILAATAGLLLVVAALVARASERRAELLELLELPYAEDDLDDVEDLAGQAGLLEPSIGAVGRMLDQLEVGDRIARSLERGRIPLRPGEVVLGAVAGGIAFAVWFAALTGQPLFAALFAPLGPVVAVVLVKARISRRRRAIEQELPQAMSMMASSLEAGHTLSRSMDLMARETGGPLAEEFAVVLAETRLGSPLTDAMDRMADRVEIEDLEWVVQAVRIQQEVGGRLSELLHTLAEYLLAREEVRREVGVLTAEGRLSSIILAVLPLAVAAGVQVISPGYLNELLRVPGIVFLGYAVVSVVIGVAIVLRMVRAVRL